MARVIGSSRLYDSANEWRRHGHLSGTLPVKVWLDENARARGDDLADADPVERCDYLGT